MEITVNIKCPDLPLAAAALAKALLGMNAPIITAKDDIDPEAVKAALDKDPALVITPETVAPAQPPVNPTTSATHATTTPATATTAPTAPAAVPTSPAPTITGDMVAKAGADLLAQNPGAMPQLMGLLQKYGVGCAQELRPEQIGPFATEMRALGAKI